MILPRAVVVLALLLLLVLARRLYRQWRASVENERPAMPRLPAELVGGADRTWVVFTTPYCASCGPVVEQLRASDPSARVVTLDATREPYLATAFRVRAAPTVLLAAPDGQVRERLVGSEAVSRFVPSPG